VQRFVQQRLKKAMQMTDLPFLTAAELTTTPIVALYAREWEEWAAQRGEALRRAAATTDFKAQAGRSLFVTATDGAIERIVLGLGEDGGEILFGVLAREAPEGDYRIAEAPHRFDATLIMTAWGLGAYAFTRYKPRRRGPPRLAIPQGADRQEGERIVRAVWAARDLVNTPANDMGPHALHEAAESVARACGARCEAIVGDALLAQNYPMIHAVGRAAKEAPRLVRLSWGDRDKPCLALVGKGVTFDSGGLNIKPDAGMRIMKKDMGGAAIALSLGQAVIDSGWPVRVEITLAIVENAIAGDAFRPGDVIATRKGLTVEIDNTDAEGRLILADALTRAGEDQPELTLDFATLTGAARTALGPDITPFYTNDSTLAEALNEGSAYTRDALWRMPLWPAYEADMDSPIADLKNTGDGAMAGSIYGGLFLKSFAPTGAWAHFDTYCWSPKDKPGRPAGGDAQGLRAAYWALKRRYQPR
jgi:leucyl aminopeptidase